MRKTIDIELNFKRKYFEEVYFNGKQGSYLNNVRTKKPFRNMLTSGLIFFFFLIEWMSDGGIQIGTVMIGIVFLYFLVDYLTKAYGIWKRNKKVAEYLNDVGTIKNYRLILTDKTFQIQQELKTTTEFWEDFKNPEINEMFAYLVSKTESYLIPKKSMTELEYQELKSILRERIC